jgi:hypothetical protein
MDLSDPEAILDVHRVVVPLRQPEEILALHVLDACEDAGISEELSGLFEREQMVVERLNDGLGIFLGELVHLQQPRDILVLKLQEPFAMGNLLVSDLHLPHRGCSDGSFCRIGHVLSPS